jgi:hypothetical protein
MKSWKLLASAVVAAAASGCSASAGIVTTPTVDEQHALQGLRAHLVGPTAASPVFTDGPAHDVAIAVMKQLSNPALPEVGIYRWNRSGWQPLARVSLDVGGSLAQDEGGATTPITTIDLTPASPPELVVTVHYNAGPATAVISGFGGRWHTLTFHGGLMQDGDERFDVQVGADGSLRSHENNCVPNCAAGHVVTTVYRFDPATGWLTAHNSK